MPRDNKPAHSATLPGRVRTILATKGLTLRQASRKAEMLYGKSTPFFLPHNLYYDLGADTFTPSLHQLFALSRISNYRLADWMRVFGFALNDLIRLQVLLPLRRTFLLDPSLDDPNSWIPWFRSKSGTLGLPNVAPLGQLLECGSARRVSSFLEIDGHSFLYAKLGRQDAFAFPDLLPGSIVRVNPRSRPEFLAGGVGTVSEDFFLIAYAKGFCCCRLQVVGKNRIVPISTQLPYAQVELRIPEDVTILGVVDSEIRPLVRFEPPEVPQDLARHWPPEPLHQSDPTLGHFLRDARTQMALSFRESSSMSRQIANLLENEQYFASPGSLSDYETRHLPPRHIHKAITLCAIYGLNWSAFLKSGGLRIEEAGTDFIPDELLPRPVTSKSIINDGALNSKAHPVSDLIGPWAREIPVFLLGSLSVLSGIRDLSLHDVFWIGGEHDPAHPNLRGGQLAIVNRRRKRPVHWKFKPPWQQPVYVVLKRDGNYLCACCCVENGVLIVHSYSQGFRRSERMRNRKDAEVVGQIVTIARKLS